LVEGAIFNGGRNFFFNNFRDFAVNELRPIGNRMMAWSRLAGGGGSGSGLIAVLFR
jgi:hypothetical protein